jgi:hypothetical protein
MDGDLGSGDGGRMSGRKTRRGGRGYWEGRTSQSIDGRLDMRLCPSPVRPWPRTAWASIYFLICSYHGSSRRRSASERNVALHISGRRTARVWHLAVARCTQHVSQYTGTVKGTINLLLPCMRLCFFSNCDMYQIKIRTHHGMSSIVRYAYVCFMRS